MKKKHSTYRPTWAEIDLKNIAYNLRQVRKLISPGVKVLVCVKADAYGHGLIPVTKKLASCGVDYLGVASIDEGAALRNAGIKKPILILGMILKEDLGAVLRYGLTPTICTLELAEALNRKALSSGKSVKIHIKVDTGMGRIGVLHQHALDLVERIARLKYLEIEGLFTHLASADTDRSFTLKQIKMFRELKSELEEKGIHIPLVHTANSMGLLGFKDSHFDMVRPGLIIYGLYPKKGLKVRLRPVLSLKTKVMYAKKLPRGHGISYGSTYKASKDTAVITLPIGYGDGYPRNLSGLGPLLLRGKKFRISGRVCMDQVMADTGGLEAFIGEEVVLIGSQGKHKVSAEDLAELSGTIPYEITCGLGSRIPRVYTK